MIAAGGPVCEWIFMSACSGKMEFGAAFKPYLESVPQYTTMDLMEKESLGLF